MTSWTRHPSMRILIAEDSTTQAEQLTEVLEKHGLQVIVASDGEDALTLANNEQPDLVISDVVMPRLDGYGLCSAIKESESTRNIPLILVTTLSDPEDVLRGLECGADNFIRKPIDERYLLSRIDYLLMNRELRAHQKTQIGIEIDLRGQRYFINSDRQQILDLLISTYEQAVDLNKELSHRERELAASNEVLDSLYGIAEQLNKAVTEREVLENVIDHVMKLPDVHAAWISLPDKDGTLRIQAAQNIAVSIGDEHADANCPCLTGLLSKQFTTPVNIFGCECLRKMDAKMRDLKCHATVPLWLSSGSKLGVMNLVAPDEYGFDDAHLQMLAGVGNQLTVALDRAELHQNLEGLVEERTAQVKRLNRLYSVLSGINTTIVRMRTQSELFSEVCRIAIDHGEFAFAWIGTVDSNARKITQMADARTASGSPAPDQLSQIISTIERTEFFAEALQTREPAIRNNVTSEQFISRTSIETAVDFKSMVLLPLMIDGSVAAICALYASEPDAFDDKEELRLLVEIAGDIGYALGYQEKERRLNYLAYFDDITGLPNRTLLMDRLNQAMQEASRQNFLVGVATLDLQRFKNINDSLGHATGDALLKAVAERLQGQVRAGDTVARIAGDEFALVFSDLRQVEDIGYLITDIESCFGNPFIVGDNELFINTSLGISVYPIDVDNAEGLMQCADAAMYRAKDEGRSGYHFYSADMTTKANERLTLENDLRRALDKGEFVLHYQPVVDAKTGKITGVEALVRWLSPERGFVPPFSFIPIAEETALIIDIGAWVLEEACRQVASGWGDIGSEMQVAVNVSTRQFLQGDFLGAVIGILERTGIDSKRLTLEITESHLMQDVDEMVAIMHKLGELGIRFAIDDFGTGYSSLAYLKNLPIANLKIDRSFVSSLPDNANDASIVKTIISMAHSLSLRVIAEGVETKEQLEFLKAHDCDDIQGYYFSKPLPPDELAVLIKRGKL
jgi:diguanylate cyclase (GGDEF)-like protein